MIRVVILLGQRVEKFFHLTFARAHIHACDVEWAHYGGQVNCPRHGLVWGPICPVCDTVLLNFQVVIISVQNCNTTPMLVLLTSSFRDFCHSPYIPSAVNHWFRAEGQWQVMFCQDNYRHAFYDRRTQKIFPFLLWKSTDIDSYTLKIYELWGSLFLFLITVRVWRTARVARVSGCLILLWAFGLWCFTCSGLGASTGTSSPLAATFVWDSITTEMSNDTPEPQPSY